MKKAVAITIVNLTLIAAPAFAKEAAVSCKTSMRVIGACFTVHGRLTFSNGNPSVRIWWIGTNRILGVFDGNGKDESESAIPPNVRRRFDSDPFMTKIYGNYEVCPLSQERKGSMQYVCIEQAHSLIVRHLNVQK